LVLEYKQGGDLRFHLGKQRKFHHEQVRNSVSLIARLFRLLCYVGIGVFTQQEHNSQRP